MIGGLKKELIVIKVARGENHHDICKFISSQAERINAWEILILPEGAEVDCVSGQSGYIDMTNLSDEDSQ